MNSRHFPIHHSRSGVSDGSNGLFNVGMELSCTMSIRFSLQVRSFFCFIFLVSRYFTCMLLPCRNNSLFRAEFLLYFAVTYLF
jgi:hypothetical protein